MAGDVLNHNGTLYKSVIDGSVYSLMHTRQDGAYMNKWIKAIAVILAMFLILAVPVSITI